MIWRKKVELFGRVSMYEYFYELEVMSAGYSFAHLSLTIQMVTSMNSSRAIAPLWLETL